MSRRWSEHKKKLKAGSSTCTRLQSAWNKYGAVAFVFEVIEVVDQGVLLKREQFWIDHLKPEYNVAPVAGSQAGIRHSESTKALLARIAKPITPEQRAKMVAGIRNMSDEAKLMRSLRQSAAHKGNKYALGTKQSEETKRKKSEKLKGRIFTEEHREKLRANHWRKRVVV
jgi:group I intron endonuclease